MSSMQYTRLGNSGLIVSRLAFGAMTFGSSEGTVFAAISNLGVGNQEAYQLLQNAAGILYALTYLVMFAIPLAAPGEKPS